MNLETAIRKSRKAIHTDHLETTGTDTDGGHHQGARTKRKAVKRPKRFEDGVADVSSDKEFPISGFSKLPKFPELTPSQLHSYRKS